MLTFTFTRFKEINSTQTYAKDNNLDEGAVIIADAQTASYGRMQRAWQANAGGLWFSLVLKPPLPPEKCLPLSLLASLTLTQTVNAIGANAKVKWPNDVLINDKKLAGILLEMQTAHNKTTRLVIGIGINIDNTVDNNIAATLAGADKEKILKNFLKNFDIAYSTFLTQNFAPFQKSYNSLLSFAGQQISVDTGTETKTGILRGVDENGRLMLGNNIIVSGTVIREN